MARRRGSVLVDTNVIFEAYWTASRRVRTVGCRVESAEECVTETRTGYRHRRREPQIDEAE